MNWIKKTVFLLGITSIALTSCNKDENKSDAKLGDKDGILLVTFGSSFPAPQATFKKIDLAAKTKYQGEEIRWGYTSDIILNKLRQGNGEGSLNGTIIDNDTPEEALKTMLKDGYSKFAIQSLHVIPGEEFDELLEDIEAFEQKHEGVHISVGRPLLDTDADIIAVAKILAEKFKTNITEGPVCFMGHGTPHHADDRYLKLETELKKINTNFFVGTVEGIGFNAGETSIGGIVNKLAALSIKPTKVTISPLMSIAGDHANNDMNGVTGQTDTSEQSWRERLVGEGYIVTDVMKGLGDYDEFNAIWMAHLEASKH
jgi:sirohydrochlorin cobaltochelatase